MKGNKFTSFKIRIFGKNIRQPKVLRIVKFRVIRLPKLRVKTDKQIVSIFERKIVSANIFFIKRKNVRVFISILIVIAQNTINCFVSFF